MFKFSEANSNAEAAIVDGILILTLPDAVRPVVWQMQLGQAKASALEVREGAEGNHTLVIKTPRADSIEIAAFTDKDKAVSALMAVSRVLSRAHGQLNSSHRDYPVPAVIPQRSSILGRIFKFLGGILLFVIVLLLTLALLSGLFGSSVPVSGLDTTGAGQQSSLPGGQPMNAEDFLNNQ